MSFVVETLAPEQHLAVEGSFGRTPMDVSERQGGWTITELEPGEPDLQHEQDWKLTPEERFAAVYQLLEMWFPNGQFATGPPRVLEVVDRGEG